MTLGWKWWTATSTNTGLLILLGTYSKTLASIWNSESVSQLWVFLPAGEATVASPKLPRQDLNRCTCCFLKNRHPKSSKYLVFAGVWNLFKKPFSGDVWGFKHLLIYLARIWLRCPRLISSSSSSLTLYNRLQAAISLLNLQRRSAVKNCFRHVSEYQQEKCYKLQVFLESQVPYFYGNSCWF